DAADNETTTTVYYKKDTIEPSPSVYFSNGTTTLYSGDIIINKDYTVYASVFEEGSGVQKVEYCLNNDNGTLVNTVDKAGTEGCSLAELISKDGVDFPDGQYSVSVKATDYAGNFEYAPNLDFTLDTTAPTMPDSFWPILQVYDGTNWVNIVNGNEEGTDKLNENEIIGYTPWGTEIRKSIYYIDASKQYRYLVKVVDAGGVSDTPEEVIKLKNNEVPGIVDNATPLEEDGAKIFYINIDNGKLSANLHKTVDFTITDKAGNTKNDVSAFWGLKLIDTQISVTPTLYEKVDGNLIAVSLTEALKDELAKGTSKPYCIVLDVSSAYTIDGNTITLSYYNHENTLITMTGTDYNTEKGYDPTVSDSSGRYHYYKMYDMEGTSNISYKNLAMSAADTNSQSVNNTNVLSMLYDITDPIMYSDSSKTTYFTLPSAWAKNVSGSIYIIPGEDTVVESALAKAYFDVEGEDGVNNLGMDMAGTSAGGTVETPANFSSATTAGTKITVYAEDAAGNGVTWEQTVKVDAKAPTIDSVSVAGNPNILVSDAPLKAAPTITAKVTDNLTVDYIKMTVTYPDGTVKEKTFDYAEGVDAEVNGTAKEVSYTIPKLAATDANIPDGAYRVEVKAFDLAGNEATSITKSFRVDTTKPVVTAKISSGTVSAKDSYYYKSNVVVALTYNDVNTNMPSIVVTDNGTPVNVNWSTSPDANGNYTATYTASTEGVHAIKIIAKDAATNDAVPSEVEFKIDKTLPTLSTTVNGLVYTDNTGLLYMTNNVTLNASVNDTNEDRGDLNYQLILTKPDQETVTNLYQKTSDRSFAYTEEGEYTINLFAVDKANNQSSIRSIRFRIDKAAPNLSINGVGSGSSADSVTVSCVMQESFWRDAEGTITIYSRAGDGVPEVLLKTINVTPTSASTVISETFTETGVYRIEFTASDRAGHTSETSTQFTIDREAPVVTLEGPENYAKTKDEVPIAITVVDDFYLQKKVNLVATRTDDTGKVHDLDFGTWNEGGNPTNIAGTFAEDGIYDISITATDMAGNSDSKSVHFTIDKSAPIIGDLSYLDDQILTSFSWDEDLDELVSDLTVCDVQMYLNGSVYDGESEIEDGAYTLLIVAEDELGNKTEKEVTFVLDTKVPVFIVTGVEEDEVKNEEYSISVSLQLEEDTLTSVTLNGKEMYSGDNNVCSFTVSEKGEYKLVMSATDAAGNTASYELEFKYGEESMWWLWLIIAIAVLLVSGIVLIVIKKKNNDK
ncbi:MAG: Ig-like domain repeat protein, partial [Lachnospiraceae bacterium]|nr:Ig-like domain repeat protein [Lachnospiraceae bacterium]